MAIAVAAVAVAVQWCFRHEASATKACRVAHSALWAALFKQKLSIAIRPMLPWDEIYSGCSAPVVVVVFRMEHAPELDAVSGLDAVVLGPEAPEDAARRALRVPTLEHHVADPDAYLELYERHSWARRRGHGPPMLEGRPFFHEREVDDWQRPMACSVVVRAGAARVLRRDGAGAASRWAWRPGPEDRWVVPTALLAARDPGPFDPAEDAEQPGGEPVRCPCCREDLAPVLRQTSKPGDASPGLSLWRQLASYGAWCPGCRRGFAMRDAVVLDRPLLPYVSAYDLPRGHLLERPGATYVRFEDDRHRVPAGTRLLVCPEPVDARVLAEAGAGLCGNQPLVLVVLTKLQNSLARSNRSRFG